MFVSVAMLLQVFAESKEEVEGEDRLATQLFMQLPKEVFQLAPLIKEELIKVKDVAL